jgi:hypothetical protein
LRTVIAVFALWAGACARTPSLEVKPLPCPAGGLPLEPVAANVIPPVADSVFIPPLPLPPSVRGAKGIVRLVVNADGKPFADSITICGIRDRRYSRQLGNMFGRWTFRPAQRDGVPITAPTRIAVEFFGPIR